MFALALALVHRSDAAADIEFKSSSPVSIYVDGRQASQPSPLKHRMSALDAGVHQLKVVGMFGKTLYEAEIDLPDNTITRASWERGEIKVVSTDWLPVAAGEATAGAEDTGADEEGQAIEVVEVEEPAPVDAAETPEPAADAVAAVDPAPAAAAATTAAGVALATEPAVEPVAAAAATPPAAAPVARTLKVQAADGMRIEVVYGGQKITLVANGGTIVVEDGTGLSFEVSGTATTGTAAAPE
jgi:hypothetical protein